MAKAPQKFSQFLKIEEGLLAAKLRAARSVITHSGEKGRALEHQVIQLLRAMLPEEYGLSTGFIAYHSPQGIQLSSQLDIIIYDALRGGPIFSLETCDVFPLESVFACVEVKASLTRYAKPPKGKPAGHSIEAILRNAQAVGTMRQRRYWVPSQPTRNELRIFRKWMSIRFYVVAFELRGASSLHALALAMANESVAIGPGGHVHGLFIVNKGFLYSRTVDPETADPMDNHNVKFIQRNPLRAFRLRLLVGLNSFPRPQQGWSPGVDQYLGAEGQAVTVAPAEGRA